MSYERTDLMEPYELQMFQVVKPNNEELNAQWKALVTEEEMPFCEALAEKMNIYAWNIFEQNKLNAKIYQIREEAEWKAFFTERAARLSRLYEENETIFQEVKAALERPFTDGLALFWRNSVIANFHNRLLEDSRFIPPILEKLMAYYEASGKHKHLPVVCYLYQSIKCMSQLQVHPGETKDKYAAVRKALALRHQIAECDYPALIVHSYAMLNYYGLRDGSVSLTESYRLLKEVIDFWATNPLKDCSSLQAQMQAELAKDATIIQWLNSTDGQIDDAPEEIRKAFCELSAEMAEKMKREGSPLMQFEHTITAAKFHAEILGKESDYHTALKKLFQYYVARNDSIKDHVEDTDAFPEKDDQSPARASYYGVANNYELLSFMLETVICLQRWAGKCTDAALVSDVMNQLIKDLPTFYRYFTNLPLEVSIQLADLCFAIMPYIKGQKEKERWVFELVTKKQFVTHLHSVMVQKEAQIVAKALYEARPELFTEVRAQIKDHPLPEFISECALLHDIGKNDIATIVNVQARALSDDEFIAIKEHPSLGYKRLLDDPDFACYRDIVLAHHKSYDGKSGYPLEFDNTKSPYRIVSDLITICDCMDAATDTLGRNYKRAKTVDELIAELKKEAGTRYNPDIVELISESSEVQEQLKTLIVDQRLDTAYEIAMDFE